MFGIEKTPTCRHSFLSALFHIKDIKRIMNNSELDDQKKAQFLFQLWYYYGIKEAKLQFYDLACSSNQLKELYSDGKGTPQPWSNGVHYNYSRATLAFCYTLRKLYGQTSFALAHTQENP